MTVDKPTKDLNGKFPEISDEPRNKNDNLSETYLCRLKFPCFGDIRVYTAVFTLLTTVYGLYWGYITAVITFIERRYQMSSSMSGFMLSSPEIGRIIIMLFISHFGNRLNMARVIATAFSLVSLAVFCQTIPHYAIKPDLSRSALLANGTDLSSPKMCLTNLTTDNEAGDASTAISIDTYAAYAIFVAFCMMMGASASPYYSIGFTYIENNSKSSQTGSFLGWANSGWAFGPMIGLFLAAWCATVYVDMGDTNLTTEDPAWVGVWWLGLIIISACQFTVSIMLCFFPKRIPVEEDEVEIVKETDVATAKVSPMDDTHVTATKSNKKVRASELTAEEKKEMYGFKGFLKSLIALVKNPVYIFLMLGFAVSNLYIGGFLVFNPKFIEEQFSLSASRAIIVTALVNGIGTGLATVIGGQIVSRLGLSLRGLYRMIFIINVILVAFSLATIFVGCESRIIDGVSDTNSELAINNACNADCDCDLSLYSPVCDNGLIYFSPCHAGCGHHNVTREADEQLGMYLGCSCTASGTAMPGACPNECKMLIPSTALVTGVFLAYGALYPPMYLLLMRVVEVQYISLGIGLSTMAVSLLGWMPGPSLYGAVIDTTCLVWEETISGAPGSCWIYNLPSFRYKILGLNTGCFVLLLIFVVISYVFHKRSVAGKYKTPDQ